MTRQLMREELGIDNNSASADQTCAFVGDSPNDAEMFATFAKSVGVANIKDLIDRCDALPTWITQQRSGAGLSEFARLVLAAKEHDV